MYVIIILQTTVQLAFEFFLQFRHGNIEIRIHNLYLNLSV